jgi:retron-type reverse transcriptase
MIGDLKREHPIQQAIAQVLTPIFDPGFSESSFGFRPGRSAHDAVRQLRDYLRQGVTDRVYRAM